MRSLLKFRLTGRYSSGSEDRDHRPGTPLAPYRALAGKRCRLWSVTAAPPPMPSGSSSDARVPARQARLRVCLETSGADFLVHKADQAAGQDGDEGDLDESDEVFLRTVEDG